jgi:NADH-quinone oxidoreductase subunit C
MNTEMNDKIVAALKEKFEENITNVQQLDLLTITINKNKLIDVVDFLYKNDEFKFRFLTDLTGIHLPDQKDDLGVIYHLHNLVENVRLRLKVFASTTNPNIHSLTSIFPGANWMERETFDFYGIHFNGHPNLKRILNVDEMTIHPLRKEFPLEDQTRKDKNDSQFGR